MRYILFILIGFTLNSIIAQENLINFSNFNFRNIGPANQGGRITDIEAHPNDFTKVYIAAASGGVWKSENAGTSWKPIFDNYETASIGDIALDPSNLETIWVGTGEANNRNSVSWGNGIFKSIDGGKTFENKGLESTHQIARVLVNPKNGDDVCVCAIGHLWGYSGERGLFKTANGGSSWEKLTNGLPNDGKTGCTDLVRDSKNPDVLYAAFYQRLRKPWTFNSGGEEGGIYKSINGGKSWKKLANGLPKGSTGRIGLAIYNKNPKIIMAIVEAEKTDTLTIPGSGIYRSEDGGESWKYVNTYNNRPFYYSQIRINPNDDQLVYALTTRFMVSKDGGISFKNGSEDEEVHGDFHSMWLDPNYKDRYYLGADKGLSITHNQGKEFTLIDNLPIAQFYRISFDMREPYYVYGGLQDNGSYATASFSREARGILNDANWKMHWGDGQDAAVNPNDWTDMYTSMEKGSYFKYNPKTRAIYRISPNAFNTINYKDYFKSIPEKGDPQIRYNWSAPLVMSPHNSSTIFVGGNYLFKSTDKGISWKIISHDLSTNHPEKRLIGNSGGITPDNTGAENHCAITSIAVSEISENIIWVGTDDGNIQVTIDGGKTWTNTRPNISNVPEGIWVSRIEASKFSSGRAFVSFDGHRSDNFDTWIFTTEDFGKTWKLITNGFESGETVRVIREDTKNADLLFAGTETGLWFSINRGMNWSRLKLNMPTVSIYDLKIHPKENDLIVGTHGRGLWILDDISPLQQMNQKIQSQEIYVFDQKPSTLWENLSRGGQRGHFWFAGENPKSIQNTSSMAKAEFNNLVPIKYWVGDVKKDSVNFVISNISGSLSKKIKLEAKHGLNIYYWNRSFDSKDFTENELIELDKILKSVVSEMNNSTVSRIYAQYQKANTSNEKRKLLENLTWDYTISTLVKDFLNPIAGPGSYLINMSTDHSISKNVIVVREDPMLKDE